MYGEKAGCADICLRVPRGQIFGLLGPNGAGKSTLVKTLVGLLGPTSGRAKVLGLPLGSLEAKKKIGFLPENFRYQDWMTLAQLLNFHGSLYGLHREEYRKRARFVVQLVNLQGNENRKIRTFSKGMQQRAGLACALLPDPELLFLDEPTSALDPLGRVEVRRLLTSLKQEGKTVFLNSHLLSEVEAVCDRVAFIRLGRIVRQGSLADVYGGDIIVEMRVEGVNSKMHSSLQSIAQDVSLEGNKITVKVSSEDSIPLLADKVIDQGGRLYELRRKHATLEEVFIDLANGVSCHDDNN